MAKTLKLWNGRAPGGKKGKAYTAAYSQKHAVELLNKAFEVMHVGLSEIQNFHSPMWGNTVKILGYPTEPCVYWQKDYKDNYEKLL